MSERDAPDLFTAPGPAEDKPDATTTSLGQRLHSARELRGLSLAHCASRLHLPVKVLQRLEADDYGSPEHFVFVRGALQGYACFLELPAGACDGALRAAAPVAQPELVSVAHTSAARWLLQRYGTAAIYIVLTAFIAVPLVVLGLRGGLHRPAASMVSLDQAPAATAQHTRAASGSSTSPGTTSTSPDSAPFRASMTPFAAIGLGDADATSGSVADAAAAQADGQHTLTVNASADCWFEIVDANGTTIASGMLHAGDVRTWHADGVVHATFGNAAGVTVSGDGKPVDLGASHHAGVARLDLFDTKTPGVEND